MIDSDYMSEKHQKICLQCGKDFLSNRNKAKYCSNNCRINSMSTILNPLRKRKVIKCKECSKEVEVQNYVKTKFCSISCSSKNQQKNLIETIKQNCRRIVREKTGKKPFTNINITRI